jgi:hypothetical protein
VRVPEHLRVAVGIVNGLALSAAIWAAAFLIILGVHSCLA